MAARMERASLKDDEKKKMGEENRLGGKLDGNAEIEASKDKVKGEGSDSDRKVSGQVENEI